MAAAVHMPAETWGQEDEFWQCVDETFALLETEFCPGEAIANNWWILPADSAGSHKLVFHPDPGLSLVDVVVGVHDVLAGESRVAGAKLHGGDTEWLVIIYVCAEDPADLPIYFLPYLLQATGARNFVPHNAVVKSPCAAWWGHADKAGTMCWPVL